MEPTQKLKTSRPVISLDGEWAFSYDPGSIGEKEGWFAPEAAFPETATVPGCDQAARHPSAGCSEAEFRGRRRLCSEGRHYPGSIRSFMAGEGV